MLTLEIDAIRSHLQEKGVEVSLQKETNQLCILLKIEEVEFPLFIRIFDGGELLQLLAFIPCNISNATASDTARLLHLLNKEVDLPGFGMDEAASVVFYRSMLPTKDKQIDPSLMDAYINATELVCKTFAPVITAVAQGAITFAEVLKKAKENQSTPQS